MKSLLQRWRCLVTEQAGAGMAALYVINRLLQRLSGGRGGIVPYVLVAQPVGSPTLAAVKSDPLTVVRQIAPDDPVVFEFPRAPEVIARRFADRSECHVAWVKDTFAGYIWIARGRYVEDEVRCVYEIADPDRGVWDYDVYVEPRHRLGRTLARLWKAVDDQLASQGVKWSFSRINHFNQVSLRSHKRLGCTELGRVVFVVLGRLQIRISASGGTGVRWLTQPVSSVARVSLKT